MGIPTPPGVVVTALVRHDHDPEESYVTLLEHPPGLDVDVISRVTAK